mmetsp:Transcript_25086/g.74506  ORF Transcript_25086/g.74506 Transcript_25086/m.74506 type:complete len:256 (-) Transcript_25086:160-927(-)
MCGASSSRARASCPLDSFGSSCCSSLDPLGSIAVATREPHGTLPPAVAPGGEDVPRCGGGCCCGCCCGCCGGIACGGIACHAMGWPIGMKPCICIGYGIAATNCCCCCGGATRTYCCGSIIGMGICIGCCGSTRICAPRIGPGISAAIGAISTGESSDMAMSGEPCSSTAVHPPGEEMGSAQPTDSPAHSLQAGRKPDHSDCGVGGSGQRGAPLSSGEKSIGESSVGGRFFLPRRRGVRVAGEGAVSEAAGGTMG